MTRLFVCLLFLGGVADSVYASDCSFASRNKSDKSLVYRTAAGAGLLVLGQSFAFEKDAILSDTPRWTDKNLNGYDLLGEKMRWAPGKFDEASGSLSDNSLVLTSIGAPFVAFIGESKGICLYEDLIVFEETVTTAMILNQVTKSIARRERPFARDLSDEERQEICQNRRDCIDLNLSFYSGHSSMAFVAAVAAGTIARQRGYDSAVAAYSIGLLGAGLTAYLRVAAGKHYLSDVTVGAIMGSAVGYIVPTYLQPLKQGQRNVALMPQLDLNSQGVSLMGTW